MTIKEEYEKICNRYLVEFANKYELTLEPDAWVGGSVGTIACVSDFFFGFADIRRCVDEDVEWQDLIEWYDYTTEAVPLGFNNINLKSWLMGAPRASKDEIERIKSLRNEIDDIVKSANEKNGG